MELIKPGTKYDFVGISKPALGLSLVLILAGLLSLIVKGGPNYGIDFTGGSVIQVRFPTPPETDEIRTALQPLGLQDVEIQDFTDNIGDQTHRDFLLRLPLRETEGSPADASRDATAALRDKFGADKVEIVRTETVGPRVGETLRSQAITAVLFGTLMMGVYIWARFELRFGIGAFVALAHDVLVTVGFLSIFNYEFDLNVVAALLTIVGFSVNDTVIISDRIRENMQKDRHGKIGEIINRSINETLSRTIITTGTALLTVVALYLLGGNVIRGFAFSLLVGFVAGTYSTVFIAGPIVQWMDAGDTGDKAKVKAKAKAAA